MSARRIFTLISLFALAMVPALSQDAILSGVDLWATPADGRTYADFTRSPIPADFFCAGSRSFTGKIEFVGTPIKTYPAGAYGNADTVIHRLDDAYSNEDGIALTRIQVRALSFGGTNLFVNECGSFNVSVRLAGEQPITEMRIVKETEGSGTFESPLDINVMVDFTPATDGRYTKRALKTPTLSLPQQIRFAPNASARWSQAAGSGGHSFESTALVDTNNDGEIDTELPGTTNFAAGWSKVGGLTRLAAQRTNCHCNILISFEGGGTFEEAQPTQITPTAAAPCQHLHCPIPITPIEQPVEFIE